MWQRLIINNDQESSKNPNDMMLHFRLIAQDKRRPSYYMTLSVYFVESKLNFHSMKFKTSLSLSLIQLQRIKKKAKGDFHLLANSRVSSLKPYFFYFHLTLHYDIKIHLFFS